MLAQCADDCITFNIKVWSAQFASPAAIAIFRALVEDVRENGKRTASIKHYSAHG